MKFSTLIALSKTYISIKFSTTPSKIEKILTIVDKSFDQFVVMPTVKTVIAIVPNFLSGNLTLKVEPF